MPIFLRLPAVCDRTGLSRSSIYAAIKSGHFPQPIKIGPRASAWPSDAIEAWMAERIAAGWSPAVVARRRAAA
jgi:prophage regulatory protein